MEPNSKNGYGDISEDMSRLLELTKRCKRIEAFEFEGVKYLGNFVSACKQFCAETSYPSDFHVWLQNNYKSITD